MEKPKLKTGQVWRSKMRGHCITVGKKLKDDWWKVHSSSKRRAHMMQEHSFHFYELVQTAEVR